MRVIDRWLPEERTHFRGLPFATMDPGQHGALLYYPAGSTRPTAMAPAIAPDDVLELVVAARDCVLVLEDRFLKSAKNVHAILELTFTAGIVVGVLAEKHGPLVKLDLFEVKPKTWMARLRAMHPTTITTKGDDESEGAALANTIAAQELANWDPWQQAPKKLRTGIAAAYGIAKWWRS